MITFYNFHWTPYYILGKVQYTLLALSFIVLSQTMGDTLILSPFYRCENLGIKKLNNLYKVIGNKRWSQYSKPGGVIPELTVAAREKVLGAVMQSVTESEKNGEMDVMKCNCWLLTESPWYSQTDFSKELNCFYLLTLSWYFSASDSMLRLYPAGPQFSFGIYSIWLQTVVCILKKKHRES